MPIQKISYLGLGSNLGDSYNFITNAITQLKAHKSITDISLSKVYQSKAIGSGKQNDYHNAVAKISTSLTPEQLLELCWQLEKNANRNRTDELWSARTLDIDILIYETQVVNTANLTIPHKLMFTRDFVLVPLLDVLDKNIVINGENTYDKATTIINSKEQLKLLGVNISFVLPARAVF